MTMRITVIGAGPGGYAAALRAAQLGARVTIVEAEAVGGTCLNWGCIPSKVMKTTADKLDAFRHAEEFGVQVAGEPLPDMRRLMERKRHVIQTQARGMAAALKRQQVDYVAGRATIDSRHRVAVRLNDGGYRTVEGDGLIIAAGTRPRPLPGLPFDGRSIVSSDHILDLDHVPRSIAIVGGGVIGCEFAFILTSLGSRVTVIEELTRLLPLPSVDEDCSKLILREMKKRKIAVQLGGRASQANREDDGLRIAVTPADAAASGAAETMLNADMLLVCIGRSPATADLGLDRVGVALDENGWVMTDETMATRVDGIYAIGDITGPAKIMLAHAASAEGVVAAENIMGRSRRMHYGLIPSAIFTSPEVATVGLTEAQGHAAGTAVAVHRFLFRQLGKSHVIGHIDGEVKMVAEAASGRLLGVHIVGPHATELIAEAVLALKTGSTVADLADTIHPHPTLSEAIFEAAQAGSHSANDECKVND